VRIRDGQTFVIGGLIREEDRLSLEKVPILGDIPILGALFSHKNNSKQTTEIIIVITPRIIYPAQTQEEAGVQLKSPLASEESGKTVEQNP
jgi:type II secretory pathway component GspD/PulD (secretin)